MAKYKVIDEIVNEELTFEEQYDAEVEVERRLNIHRAGYFRRKVYIPPLNAIVINEGSTYIICLG